MMCFLTSPWMTYLFSDVFAVKIPWSRLFVLSTLQWMTAPSWTASLVTSIILPRMDLRRSCSNNKSSRLALCHPTLWPIADFGTAALPWWDCVNIVFVPLIFLFSWLSFCCCRLILFQRTGMPDHYPWSLYWLKSFQSPSPVIIEL